MTSIRWIGAQMSLGESDKRLDVTCETAAIPDMRPAVLDSPAEMAGTFLITTNPRTFGPTQSRSNNWVWIPWKGAAMSETPAKPLEQAVSGGLP
jgi:hypothetical protein